MPTRTCIVDSVPPRPGACRVAVFWGQGVLAADIPATGVHGAPLLRNDLSLPEDAGVEVRAQLLANTFPAGTLDFDDYGGVGTTGAPNGMHYLLYRLVVAGVPSADDIGFGPGVARAVIAIGTDYRPTTPPPAAMRASGRRVAMGGRVTPARWPSLDLAETDDVLLDFTNAMAAPDMRLLRSTAPEDILATVEVTIEPRQGADTAAAAMLVGQPLVARSYALQRLRAGVPGVTYLLRAVGTLAPSGRQVVATAFVKTERLA